MDEKEKVTSEYNAAYLQIISIEESWTKCKTLRRGGNLLKYKDELDVVYDILSEDMDKIKAETKDDYKKKINDVEKDCYKGLYTKNFYLFYLKLREIERLLRKVQELAGKGSKFKPTDDDYM